MKIAKIVVGIALAMGTIACGTAWADRGHGYGRGHGGVVFGINLGVPVGPWYYPPYYYPPNYYPYPPVLALPAYPNVVEAQSSPPVYIERGGELSGPPAQPSNYWYYCPDPQGYYPYVKECQSGWLTVLPQAPGQPGTR